MPRTKNLKLDRRAIATLPLPEVTNMHNVKLTETESQLKAIWTDVISNKITDLHKIEPATDFFHVGGTSLLLLDLQRRIERYFHVQLQLISMFSTSTLAGMSLMIENNDKQQPPTTPISWDQETDLPQALRQLVKTPLVNYSDSKIVVLTGSTGYLGQGILDALVKDPSVKKIHCIAVREANKRPRNLDSKIIVYEGDLVLPHLGLTDRDVREIFDTANLIIHNGADVSYMKAYTSLRLSNLQATKELAEMGMHRMIPFHYISSGGACSFAAAAGSQRLGPTSVAQFPPPSDSPPGYASSKWASEVFLEKLNAQHMSWSICIHRPSNIARIDTPQLDLVYNIQHYSRQLQAVPITRGKAHGTLDSVPLDTVVQGIVQATKDTPHNTLRFLHHLGGIKFPINDLRSWAVDNGCASAEYMDDGKQQAEIQEIPLHQWTASAAEQGMHPALVAFLQTFPVQGGLVFPQLIKDGDDH
jgi:hybrid polyketide synthase/nonribosomal peptide synthetase ACE1